MAGRMRSRRLLLMPTVSAFSIATVIFSLWVLCLLSGPVRPLAARPGGTGPRRALILEKRDEHCQFCPRIGTFQCFAAPFASGPPAPVRRGEGGGGRIGLCFDADASMDSQN